MRKAGAESIEEKNAKGKEVACNPGLHSDFALKKIPRCLWHLDYRIR